MLPDNTPKNTTSFDCVLAGQIFIRLPRWLVCLRLPSERSEKSGGIYLACRKYWNCFMLIIQVERATHSHTDTQNVLPSSDQTVDKLVAGLKSRFSFRLTCQHLFPSLLLPACMAEGRSDVLLRSAEQSGRSGRNQLPGVIPGSQAKRDISQILHLDSNRAVKAFCSPWNQVDFDRVWTKSPTKNIQEACVAAYWCRRPLMSSLTSISLLVLVPKSFGSTCARCNPSLGQTPVMQIRKCQRSRRRDLASNEWAGLD